LVHPAIASGVVLTMVFFSNGGKALLPFAGSLERPSEEIASEIVSLFRERAMNLGGMIIGVQQPDGCWHKYTVVGVGTPEIPHRLVPGGRHVRSYHLLTA
jgi:hypothetical protein